MVKLYVKMEPYDAYVKYIALKRHFTSESYDYFKYNNKVKASFTAFDNRRDKFFFQKLAKRNDVENFLVANFVENNNFWVGDEYLNTTEVDEIYSNWRRRQESLTYIFKTDLAKLFPTFDDNIKVVDGQHPSMLKLTLNKTISIETLVILNDMCSFFRYWSRNIKDDHIWPTMRMLCKKYSPFINYDKEKFRKIVLDFFGEMD